MLLQKMVLFLVIIIYFPGTILIREKNNYEKGLLSFIMDNTLSKANSYYLRALHSSIGD